MKSSLPKVLHEIKGRPFIFHVLKELRALKKINQIIVVVGYKGRKVKQYVDANFKGIDFVTQKNVIGTANAVGCARSKVKNTNLLVLCADAPLITRETLSKFIDFHLRNRIVCSLITARMQENNQLGVVLRDDRGNICAIRERIMLDNTDDTFEVNSGIYGFDKKFLFANLKKIKKNTRKGEYFLTDIIEMLYSQGQKCGSYLLTDEKEILGINDLNDLCAAEKAMQFRIIGRLMAKGVKVLDPATTFIEEGVKVGKSTVIYPFTFIEKGVIIGSNCSLGPFIHIRGGSRVKDNTCLGNFLEVNRSALGKSVKIKHFGYLGDATVEDDVNIGAGTVFANYDGKRKNKTLIKKGAFVGSDTILIAPVKVGKGAVTGAGSVVTKDVAAKTTVVGVPAKPFKKRKS